MRKLIVLSAIAVLALASPALAFNETFTVTGNLGVATSAGKCTSLSYPSLCPSGDNCVCYTAKKTSLHTAKGILTIPPGTTQVAVSVDTTDMTSHPGCAPAWGEIQYNQSGGGADNATIEFFASLCKPLAPGSPQTFSGGGALTSSTFVIGIFPIDVTGFGTATGTYFAGATGQNLTLNLIAAVPGL